MRNGNSFLRFLPYENGAGYDIIVSGRTQTALICLKEGMRMGIGNVLALFGGVALFLFGMGLMGDNLKLVAGKRLETVLYRLTSTPLKGLILGTVVTALIQSSSATSAMVVGFVNSGLMKLAQATGIVLGANVGTSITGWILCLSYVGRDAGALSLLSSETLAAVVALIGILLRMTSDDMTRRRTGDILLGFAVLMYGMQAMSAAVAPLKESEGFIRIMTMFEHPVLGILIGAAVTAVLQSNSAAVGILQALSVTGAVPFSIAFPMIMGMGIGAAVPVLTLGVPCRFVSQATVSAQLANCGLDAFSMAARIRERLSTIREEER